MHKADVIFIATHSQGSIASTVLIDRLMAEGHICTDTAGSMPSTTNGGQAIGVGAVPGDSGSSFQSGGKKANFNQRICLLAMCGIHLGPLGYLSGSLVGPYLQVNTARLTSESINYKHDCSYSNPQPLPSSLSFRIPTTRFRKAI